MTATKEERQAARLTQKWQVAVDEYLAGQDDEARWAALFAAEQAAYDELVDYVEAHDLNGTAYDPRGA